MTESAHPVDRSVAVGRGYTVGSFIMAAFALALLPPLFGIIGVALGVTGYRNGDPRGRTAAWCSVAAALLGVAAAALLFSGVSGSSG